MTADVRAGCIFCSQRRKMSKEHVVPDWLKNVLPRVDGTNDHLEREFDWGQPDKIQLKVRRTLAQGPVGSRKVPSVCLACNTGWMSALQERAKPILYPLIKGIWDKFDEKDAKIVALWTAMTTIIVADSYPNTQSITQADRTFLFERQAVPSNWYMWIGRGTGFNDITYCNRPMTFLPKGYDGPKTSANSCATTITLGKLILHAINLPLPMFDGIQLAYYNDFGVFPFHPVIFEDQDWRFIPFIGVGTPRYKALTDAFYAFTMRAYGPLASDDAWRLAQKWSRV